MAEWSRRMFTRVLASFLAMMLSTAVQAQTANESSFFKSLWSRITSAGEDAAPVESPGESPVESSVEPLPAPTAAPSLSSARWIGFTPVIVADQAAGGGAWVAGPFIEASTTSETTSGTTAWVADTVSGLTVQVRLIWREVAPGSLAELSAEAGKGLGLPPGAVANVTIYLAR